MISGGGSRRTGLESSQQKFIKQDSSFLISEPLSLKSQSVPRLQSVEKHLQSFISNWSLLQLFCICCFLHSKCYKSSQEPPQEKMLQFLGYCWLPGIRALSPQSERAAGPYPATAVVSLECDVSEFFRCFQLDPSNYPWLLLRLPIGM